MNKSKHTRFLIQAMGLLQLVAGLVAAYYGPLEIAVFYLFSTDGPFAYDGFGVGSLWFGLLVMHNIAYYVLAMLLIPVGIGNLRLRSWALTLNRLYCWSWLGGGALLMFNFVLLASQLGSLDIEPAILVQRLLLVGLIAVGGLLLLPALLLYFFNRRNVKQVYVIHGDAPGAMSQRLSSTPMPFLLLIFLSGIVLLALSLATFFQGLFPLFGQILLGRQGIRAIALCSVLLIGVVFGLLLRQRWAWWAALIGYGLLMLSSAMTFAAQSADKIFGLMILPMSETEAWQRLPFLHGYWLLPTLTGPLIIAMLLLALSRRYFFPAHDPSLTQNV